MKKYLTFLFIVLSFLFLPVKEVKATADCFFDFAFISPAEGDGNDVFTIYPTVRDADNALWIPEEGEDLDDFYAERFEQCTGNNGDVIYFTLINGEEAINLEVRLIRSGSGDLAYFLPITVSGFNATGNWILTAKDGSQQIIFNNGSEIISQVTINTVPSTGEANCGDVVGNINQCPVECPGANYDLDVGSDGIIDNVLVCLCGSINSNFPTCCAPGNTAGLPACPTGVCNPSTNQCQSCGNDGGTCCPDEPDRLPCLGDKICYPDNVCRPPNVNVLGYCANGDEGVNTAIGCIRIGDLAKLIASFVSFFVSLGAGVTLVLIAYAAYLIMVSAGNPKMIMQAKSIITNALLSLMMIIFATLILRVLGISVLGLF